MTRQQTPAREDETQAVRIWLLGGFRVSVGSRLVQENEWRLKKAASLLKILALAPSHRLHRDQISELLWPKLDARAASNNLHRALHFARRTLEPLNTTSRYLALQGDLVSLCPEGPLSVDVNAFEEAAATARRNQRPAAFHATLELYAGELLPEDRYETWSEERRAALRETYLALLIGLAKLYEEREEYDSAIEALQQAVSEDSTREEIHVGLMRAHAFSGEPRQAIAQYERLRRTLSRLGAEPTTASRRLHEKIRSGWSPARSRGRVPQVPANPPHNLPNARTSFVGRQREMLAIKRSLAMSGLLTLTGAGGSGKTRLALQVARNLVGAYPDGVWLVELAPLSDPELVPQAVAQALGVREQPGQALTETLSTHLRLKQTLLVLDNCEHVIWASARLADALLDACSGLRILATSREALGVVGETNWPVLPLAIPSTGERQPPVDDLARYGAIALFVDRARSRVPGFGLADENAGAVVEVCRKLDGIPLGIELAAGLIGVLATEQIAARLNDAPRLLTTGVRISEPRHQTLRATLAWSYDLLDDAERALFARLSVFAGGWTLEAAEEVCAGSGGAAEGVSTPPVLELLSRLVDKSLVVVEAWSVEERAVRYRMLEPVRQYARELLEGNGEAERIRERHARYYLAFAEGADESKAERLVLDARSISWHERMEGDHANLRAALDWSLDGNPDGHAAVVGLRLAVALFWFWQSHLTEGRRYLERAVASVDDPATFRWKARALHAAAWLTTYQGDYGAAKPFQVESVSLYRAAGDEEGLASGLVQLAMMAVLGQREDIPLSSVLEELKDLKPGLKNRSTLAYLLILQGLMALGAGDLDRSEALHEESLILLRQIGDTQGTMSCLMHLGAIALIRGDYEGAGRLMRETLRLSVETDGKLPIQITILGLGCVAEGLEQPTRAARLWGVVDGMRDAYNVHPTPISFSVSNYEVRLTAVRSQLGEEAFASAWAEGRAMPLQQAVEYALSTEEPAPPDPSENAATANASLNGLTRREKEIVALVGQGLTNARIARQLSISEHTAATHVRKILTKLNLRSRFQIPRSS